MSSAVLLIKQEFIVSDNTSVKKYEFVPGDEIIIAPGRTGKRIRAVIAITALGITPGTLGGYIESEKNLCNTQVSGNAWVSGNAQVSGLSDYVLVGPAKSSGRFTTAYRDSELNIRVTCGCFTGTVAQFAQQIESTHINNGAALEQYRLICQFIKANFDL